MRTELLRFNGAVKRDPAIDAWMKEHAGGLGAIAHQRFEVMRKCGDEVREILHERVPSPQNGLAFSIIAVVKCGVANLYEPKSG